MEAREISLGNFQSKLGSLRYGDYYYIITEIRDDLDFPEETTLEEMESLLIKASKDCFNDTIEGDITLMALGLLQGFYHHETHGKVKKEFPIKKRRIKFLNESSYLREEYEGLYAAYEDVEKAGSKAVKQVFDRLGKTEDRCINKVAAKIYNKSEARLKEYMPACKIDLPECKSASLSCGQTVHAEHVKSASLVDNAESITNAEGTVQSEGHTYRTQDIVAGADGGSFVRKHDNVTIQVNINNSGFIAGHGDMGKSLPPVEYIFVPVETINLEPQQTYAIKTAILPEEAQGSFLNYISSDTSIVTVSSDGIIFSKEKCGTTDIIIQAESGCTVKVPVSVCQKDDAIQKYYGWGPQRPTYVNLSPADHPTFNSITDNAAVGDERDFVRIEEKSSGRPYSSEIIIEPGKQYEVYIYYHNDASATYNDAAHGYAGVARDVKLSTTFPGELAKNERGAVTGRITSSNATPTAVWDEAYVTAREAVTLHYVTGSAKIYNDWGVNGSTLPTALFSTDGVLLGLNALNGVILGGSKYSGRIVYTIQTRAISEK